MPGSGIPRTVPYVDHITRAREGKHGMLGRLSLLLGVEDPLCSLLVSTANEHGGVKVWVILYNPLPSYDAVIASCRAATASCSAKDWAEIFPQNRVRVLEAVIGLPVN